MVANALELLNPSRSSEVLHAAGLKHRLSLANGQQRPATSVTTHHATWLQLSLDLSLFAASAAFIDPGMSFSKCWKRRQRRTNVPSWLERQRIGRVTGRKVRNRFATEGILTRGSI